MVLLFPMTPSTYMVSMTLLTYIVPIGGWFVQTRVGEGLVRFGRPKRTSGASVARLVVLQAYLEAGLRLLVRPANPALHLLLHAVEGVPFDQRPVGAELHAPVRPREPAVHRFPKDVRHRLTRPRSARLRPVAEPVQLLADLGDPPPLEVPSEDERYDLRLVVVHLEGAFEVPVPEGARVVQEATELPRVLVRGPPGHGSFDDLVPPEELVFIEPLLGAEPVQGLFLGVRLEVADELPHAREPHEHLPEEERVLGGKVRAVVAEGHRLGPPGGVPPFVGDDLLGCETLPRPAPLAPFSHASAPRGRGAPGLPACGCQGQGGGRSNEGRDLHP